MSLNAALIKEKNDKWQDIFDLIIQYITSIVGKEHYESKQILFILYFLEVN